MQAIWRGAISFGLIIDTGARSTARPRRRASASTCCTRMWRRVGSTTARAGRAAPKTTSRRPTSSAATSTRRDSTSPSEDELDAVPVDSMHTIDVVDFVPSEQIDPIYYKRSYYLAPDELGVRSRTRCSARPSPRPARSPLARVALRDKERLATLRVRDEGVLVMETMYWPDEVREAGASPSSSRTVDLKERELQMAQTLIDGLTEDFDPVRLKDEYRKALLRRSSRRRCQGREVVAAPAAEEAAAPVVDLMEALQASLEAVKTRQKRAG